jgi:protein-S-isoprenylcysteine O-methyltransferase Ste14
MVVRVRRKTRNPAGLVPKERLERLMWLIWVPRVIAWMALPFLATTQGNPLLAVSPVAVLHPALVALRWIASLCGLLCFWMTVQCWRRMGVNWRIGVLPDQRTELVTGGLYEKVRHPIYAFSIVLMVCSVVVVPTLPMLTVGILHIVFNILKAEGEERFLVKAHGDRFREYCRRTGRFFPRVRVRRS